MRAILYAKSSGSAPPDVDVQWKDSCDGRLAHAILNTALVEYTVQPAPHSIL